MAGKVRINWGTKLSSNIQFFYDKVMSVKKADLKSKKWETIQKDIDKEGVNIVFVVDGQKDKVVKHNLKNQIQVLVPNRNSPRLWWFIHRLRNAFAHLNIIEDSSLYYLKDEDSFNTENGTIKTKLTMYGCVEQVKLINILNNI